MRNLIYCPSPSLLSLVPFSLNSNIIFCPSFSFFPCSLSLLHLPFFSSRLFTFQLHFHYLYLPVAEIIHTQQRLTIMTFFLALLLLRNQSSEHLITFFFDSVFMLKYTNFFFYFFVIVCLVFIHSFTIKQMSNHTHTYTLNMFIHISSDR